ncbi:PadR family transcriptional regulator [Gorillibacterium timonense]|uniref:PadR family transcriptional regulator n=1 Tax=Gorillibacterium timonense TaxID=1689269 RepID=UPI00071D17E2|nr:PadR family transcriptional regulator [Gorillibacterium timonense]
MSLHYAILGLLKSNPMNGYSLKKTIDKSINHFWVASLSQIYRELNALESKGYVSSEVYPQSDKPDKKIYCITKAGEVAFHDWIVAFPEVLSKDTRDEFTMRIFFGSHVSPEELFKQFQRFKEEKQRRLEEMREIGRLSLKDKSNPETLYHSFVLKRACSTLETLMKWADECMEELRMAGVVRDKESQVNK